MSDKDSSQEPLLDANAQKPQYEAPAIVDLNGPAKGASGDCTPGSSDSNHCFDGTSASWVCDTGFAAGDYCWEGSSGEMF